MTPPEPDDSRPTPVWRALAWLAISLILITHVFLTLRLFPSLRSLLNDEPIISVDHAIHIYHGYLGARFLKEHGTSWGYDPFFMAGYPKTPVYDSSSGLSELFQLAAGGDYSPRAYKIGVALVVGLVPVMMGLAVASYQRRLNSALATMVWITWFWWSGFAHTLVQTGLVAFVWASVIAVLLPATLVHWYVKQNWMAWIVLVVVATAGIQAHSIFPLMAIAPLAVGYGLAAWNADGAVLRAPLPAWRWHAATWGAVAVALAATAPWWWPLLRFLPLKTESSIFMTHVGNPLDPVWKRISSLLLGSYLLNDARISLLLVLFGLVGLCFLFRTRRRMEGTMLVLQLSVLSALTFAGSEWTVTRNLEPLRFWVPLGLTWCIPAGEGLARIVAMLDPRRLFESWRDQLIWCAAVLFVGLSVLVTFPSVWWAPIGLNPQMCPPSTWRQVASRVHGNQPFAVGLKPEMEDLVAWIRQNTATSARILFEDQLRLLENGNPSASESLHWTPLLPQLTGREFIGGLYHLAFIPHQHAAFGDWKLAGRNIRDWSAADLWSFCERYNIGWIITWSRGSWNRGGEDRGRPLSTEVIGSLSFCERIATVRRHTTRPEENEYAIFRVRRDPSFFKVGRGRVVLVDYNRIELADLEPDQGAIVIRYHWQDGLEADPPVEIERSTEAGDPVGFIRIRTRQPIPQLSVRNGYR